MISLNGQYTTLAAGSGHYIVKSLSWYSIGTISDTTQPRFSPDFDWKEFTLGELMDIAVYMHRIGATRRGDMV